MLNYKKIALSLLAVVFFGISNAQYTLNSPYSRYGFGDLNQSGTSFNQGMGGAGIALREPNTINFLNPASYNSQDTMSFIWDFGVIGNIRKSTAGNASSSMKNMNFDHLAFSFPINRNYFMAIGAMPFSKIGYNISAIGQVDTSTFKGVYSGTGNVNQLFIGNSFGLFNKKINIGVNFSYLFGSFDHVRSQEFLYSGLNDMEQSYGTKLNGWNLNFGAQSGFVLNSNVKMILGITYQIPTSLKGNTYDIAHSGGVTFLEDTFDADYKIPARIGVGVNFIFKESYMFAFDYTYQDWKGVNAPGNINNFKAANKMNFGFQYTPDANSYISYFNRIRYRAGLYFDNSFLHVNNTDVNDYGVSLGFGLPFKRTNTMFNTALEYGVRGTTSNNLIKENYFRFSFSVSLFDFWFLKRKYQ